MVVLNLRLHINCSSGFRARPSCLVLIWNPCGAIFWTVSSHCSSSTYVQTILFRHSTSRMLRSGLRRVWIVFSEYNGLFTRFHWKKLTLSRCPSANLSTEFRGRCRCVPRPPTQRRSFFFRRGLLSSGRGEFPDMAPLFSGCWRHPAPSGKREPTSTHSVVSSPTDSFEPPLPLATIVESPERNMVPVDASGIPANATCFLNTISPAPQPFSVPVSPGQCSLCNSSDPPHLIRRCGKFSALAGKQQRSLLRKWNLCHFCFRGGHPPEICPTSDMSNLKKKD